jgi:hypothetical protein
MLTQTQEQAQGHGRIQWGKECQQCGKAAENDPRILLTIYLLSNKCSVIVAAIKNMFYFFWKGDQSNADYHKDFMDMLEVIEEYGVQVLSLVTLTC